MNLHETVTSQHTFFLTGKTKEISFRIEQLKKLRDGIKKNEELLFSALEKDLGKSRFESYTTEIGFTYSEIKHMIRKLKSWSRPRKVKRGLINLDAGSEIHYEPYGVALIMAPWNYPFQLVMAPLASVLAAGNCALIKPADYSKNTSEVIKKIIGEVFDPSYVCAVLGDRTVNQAVLDERFDIICFTGSPSLGRIVMEKAARNLTPVVLELGGKSPCIVDEDASIELAARRLVFGKFVNAGQTCIAPDYLMVHEKVKVKFLEQVRMQLKKLYGEDPHTSPDFGRIINARQYERLKTIIDSGTVIEGGQHDDADRYIAPTILDNVKADDLVMKDEIFGPILPVMTFSDVRETVSFISSREKPLALYYFTESRAKQNMMLRNTAAGGVCINDTIMHITNSFLPFGGVGNSGMGSYHGHYGFETFSHAKPVMRKTTLFDIPLRYAPYKNSLIRLARWIYE
jgi:aldehyde dehydrogenase (NAD+)